MKNLILNTAFINPCFLNLLRRGPQEWIVNSKNEITIESESLRFENNEDSYKPWTEIIVYLGGKTGFYCISKEEEKQKEKKLKEELEKKIQNEKIEKLKKEERLFLDSKDFYNKYKIPFKWFVSYKDNLSWLTENSWWCWIKKNTVYHLIIAENSMKIWKAIRNKNDCFCSKNSWKNRSWAIENPMLIKFKNDVTPFIITCKSCLKKMEIFKIKK